MFVCEYVIENSKHALLYGIFTFRLCSAVPCFVSLSLTRSLLLSFPLLSVCMHIQYFPLLLLFVFSYYSIQCFPSIQMFVSATNCTSLSLCVCLSIRVMYLYLLDKNETRALRSYTQRLNKRIERRATERNDMLWPYVYLNIYFFEYFSKYLKNNILCMLQSRERKRERFRTG